MFSSVQGEGPDIGSSTLFVRLGGCDLRCRWCDSPHTWKPGPTASLQRSRASGEVEIVDNPLEIDRVIAAAERLEVRAHRFVSLTGGEPLLQPEATRVLAQRLRALGPEIHLETHGLAAEALEAVIDQIDVVSMDWKLESEVRRESDPASGPIAPFAPAHRRFLEVARRAPRVVVKLVITEASEDAEIDRAIEAVAGLHPEATLVLQPVTPRGAVKPPGAARVLALGRRAEARLAQVRVVPQAHPLLGVR